MENLIITSDKEKLDLEYITGFISQSYWAKDRTKEMMRTCIDNSLNFGLFFDNQQIGYARVVTDYAQFAYLMDVFIDEKYRGLGYSKLLMEYILECEPLKNVKVWRLATSDAHGLYRQFGFTELKSPEKLMELFRP
ncbi:GNAT family N-acetyltransferase [Fluviicola chungangensis]|uniref:GNAT family N-acetyltransferase n=1 Tax=Fluviicola chungangensis TaxID=2597671 RepID=A0A556N2D0_9FLAO|nr:GNAT family N-acetyltransferase [Fluviicola chungangensis]TSJ46346.1 GNAT family N-acetyltransferase [Fluviicola chungangensis]